MKLTDEQRELLEQICSMSQEDFESFVDEGQETAQDVIDMFVLLKQLRSSEQAWKEEAERLKGQMDIYKHMNGKFENTFHELRTQLNQAIEALKRLLDNNQLRTGEDAKEARIEIMYILSSLSQGTEVSHEQGY